MASHANRIVLVTGGRGGIGRAIVERFIHEGATVYAADLNEHGSLNQAIDDGSIFLPWDVSSEQAAIDAAQTITAAHGKLHTLVNAAGIEIEKTIENTSLDEWNNAKPLPLTRRRASSISAHTMGSLPILGLPPTVQPRARCTH